MNDGFAEQGVLLVVDDSPTNIEVLFEFLNQSGFTILVARDGESALQQVERRLPDLILLDVMLPKLDGFAICQRLKSNETTRDIPVLFMTALANPVDRIKGLNLGAVDYITKPFQQEEILARVRIHLKLHNLTKTLAMQNKLLKKENEERIAAEDALQRLMQELEQRVEQRTAELSQALADLQQAQVQLVQQEKLSTLGELVAGVAHEINNPVGFITGNLNHAQSYIHDFIKVMRLYRQHYPHPDPEIATLIEAIDLDYLIEDLPKLLTSMQEGANRIRNISISLRTFSRSDHDAKVAFDIHEGINSTLMILRHRLKATPERPAIAIIERYEPLPLVNCYPGQLNQVFMNIIANAIEALEESNHGRDVAELASDPNTITIHTNLTEDGTTVQIQFQDNGNGIPDDIKPRIFDHLFTTKGVGKGTGLGLSICRQIVEDKHGGVITCISQPGDGTTFTITLPIA